MSARLTNAISRIADAVNGAANWLLTLAGRIRGYSPYGAPETLREVLMLNARLIVLVAILIVEVVYVVAVLP